MIRINLLPHREHKRRQRRQQFFMLSGLAVAAGVLIGLVVHLVMAGYIESQEAKNNIFKAEIAKLDKEIAEIRRLKDQIDALLARKQVIENLQSNRADAVNLFNELAIRMPEGVALKSLKQNDQVVALTGLTQSNARVSTLMRNLDGSPSLMSPQLVEIKVASLNGRRIGDFQLNVSLERPSPQEGAVETASKGGKP